MSELLPTQATPTVPNITEPVVPPPIEPAQPANTLQASPPPSKKKSFFIGLGILLLLGIGAWRASQGLSTRLTPFPSTNEFSPPAPPNFETVVLSDDPAEPLPRQPIIRPELYTVATALTVLANKNWDGNTERDLPLNFSELNPDVLNSMREFEIQKTQKYTIPDYLEELFIGYQETDKIQNEIFTIRNEYLAYLRQKGVAQKFITELDTVTLPESEDRLNYFPFNDPRKGSFQDVYIDENHEADYRQTQIRFYASDVYAYAIEVVDARLIGAYPSDSAAQFEYWRQARDIALRRLVYHEITHALQVAYIFQVDATASGEGSNYWQNSPRLLSDAAKAHFWDWGYTSPFGPRDFNRSLGDESTAEGVAYEMLVTKYQLNDSQRQALWDHSFGGQAMDGIRPQLTTTTEILKTKYPELYLGDFAEALSEVTDQAPDNEQREFLQDTVIARLKNQRAVAAAMGYTFPLNLDEMESFWAMLQ